LAHDTKILAIDQGTTSTRAIVFDDEARPVASAQLELTQHFPQPGWVEHDPLEIAEAAIAVSKMAVERADLRMADISARPPWYGTARRGDRSQTRSSGNAGAPLKSASPLNWGAIHRL
jgi:N-acetylglucosamine kinase-like BadF-type ATPase